MKPSRISHQGWPLTAQIRAQQHIIRMSCEECRRERCQEQSQSCPKQLAKRKLYNLQRRAHTRRAA